MFGNDQDNTDCDDYDALLIKKIWLMMIMLLTRIVLVTMLIILQNARCGKESAESRIEIIKLLLTLLII